MPGEYCPGAWSVNARGRTKLAGIGQRMIAGGAHAGGVLVVTGSDLLREALEPVYAALELDWDPATTGSVEDEVPGVDLDDVERAILAELAAEFELVEAETRPARPCARRAGSNRRRTIGMIRPASEAMTTADAT